eukprot:scaffold36873_cov78-Phaeocystis_antarctica.AAC.7
MVCGAWVRSRTRHTSTRLNSTVIEAWYRKEACASATPSTTDIRPNSAAAPCSPRELLAPHR